MPLNTEKLFEPFVPVSYTHLDDGGRYLLPQLPKATYKVWVRGYGLVDSKPVESTPGHTLALTAVIAPDAMSAAQYYPSDYWYSLLSIRCV